MLYQTSKNGGRCDKRKYIQNDKRKRGEDSFAVFGDLYFDFHLCRDLLQDTISDCDHSTHLSCAGVTQSGHHHVIERLWIF